MRQEQAGGNLLPSAQDRGASYQPTQPKTPAWVPNSLQESFIPEEIVGVVLCVSAQCNTGFAVHFIKSVAKKKRLRPSLTPSQSRC